MVGFKGIIKKYGNSFVITIPSDYVKHGLLKTDIEYYFEVEQNDL